MYEKLVAIFYVNFRKLVIHVSKFCFNLTGLLLSFG